MTAATAETEQATRHETVARPQPADAPTEVPAAPPPPDKATPLPSGKLYDRYGGPDSPLRPRPADAAPPAQKPAAPARPAAPPAAPKRPEPVPQEKGDAKKQAAVIEQTFLPSMMATALGMDKHVDASGYHAFLDKFMADAGSPTDPVERMLLEQLVLAHFRTAQLQAQAGEAKGLESAKLFNAAAARLLGEVRLTALSLAAYRNASAAGEDKPRRKKGRPRGGAKLEDNPQGPVVQ